MSKKTCVKHSNWICDDCMICNPVVEPTESDKDAYDDRTEEINACCSN